MFRLPIDRRVLAAAWVMLSVHLGWGLTLHASGLPQFRNTAPGVAYVGSRLCGGCHSVIYENYMKTGMGRSMSLPSHVSAIADLARPVTVFQESFRRHFVVFRDGAAAFQSEYELDESGREIFRTTHRLETVIGSGANGQSFVVRRDGALFQAPLSYYSKPRKWDLSPGFESSDVGFNRPIHSACVACHSGRANPLKGKPTFYEDPPFAELAIGCENCHGPGQLHVAERTQRTSQANRGDSTIVNPARLPGWLADNICMSCHQTGDTRVLQPGKHHGDFRPGRPLNETLGIFRIPWRRQSPPNEDLLEHYSSMVLSKCYRQSNGRLSCMSCHDPHFEPAPAEVSSYYRTKCLACHTEKSCSVALSQRRRRPAGDDCSGCHLPKREIRTIAHSALSNHRILASQGQPLPADAFSSGSETLPGVVHLNPVPGQEKAPVPLLTQLQVYGELLSHEPTYRDYYLGVLDQLARSSPDHPLVLSALGRRSRLERTPDGDQRAIAYLSRAVDAGSTSEVDYQSLAELLSQKGEIDKAIEVLKKAIDVSPFSTVSYKALALQYITQKNYAKALEIMKRHLALFPEDSFMRNLIKQAEKAKPE